MGTCVHFSRSLPSNSWWQTMAGWQVLSRPSAAEGGGRRPAFTGLATQPYSATEVDGWQHKLSRVSQNRAAVQYSNKIAFVRSIKGVSSYCVLLKKYRSASTTAAFFLSTPAQQSCSGTSRYMLSAT